MDTSKLEELRIAYEEQRALLEYIKETGDGDELQEHVKKTCEERRAAYLAENARLQKENMEGDRRTMEGLAFIQRLTSRVSVMAPTAAMKENFPNDLVHFGIVNHLMRVGFDDMQIKLVIDYLVSKGVITREDEGIPADELPSNYDKVAAAIFVLSVEQILEGDKEDWRTLMWERVILYPFSEAAPLEGFIEKLKAIIAKGGQ